MKTIGVIIPNYNSGTYIRKCLDSLLEQEYKVNEISNKPFYIKELNQKYNLNEIKEILIKIKN